MDDHSVFTLFTVVTLYFQKDAVCCMQFGAYLTGAGFPGAQNVTAADPAASYLLYQFIDMQMYADLHPVLGTCFSQTAQLNQDQSQVNQCAGATGYCCYNFTTNPLVSIASAPMQLTSTHPLTGL